MRLIFIGIFMLVSSLGYTQELNKLGKIDVEELPSVLDYRVLKVEGVYKVIKDSFWLDGNTYYKIPDGFLTTLESANEEKDFIKHYNAEGKLRVTILTDRIINLKVSVNGNKLVFFDSEQIIQVHLGNYHIDTLQGSFIYSFVQNEELIYYNPNENSLYFKNLKIKMEEYPNQIVEYKGKIIILTKRSMYELRGSSLISKYDFEGQFFDAKIYDDVFYFVDKVEQRRGESVTLYKTSDFSRFEMIDRMDDLNR